MAVDQNDSNSLEIAWVRAWQRGVFQKLAQSFDESQWRAVVREAEAHRLAPILWIAVRDASLTNALAPDLAKSLRLAFRETTLMQLGAARDLVLVAQACRAKAIPWVALKGFAVARTVYAHPGMRPMVDLDLLFRQEHLASVCTLLENLGYRSSRPGSPTRLVHDAAHVPPFVHPQGTTIEVHGRLVDRHPMLHPNEGAIFTRSQGLMIQGIRIAIPSPMDRLLHACVHASYHHGGRVPLLAYVDIAAMVAAKGFDWNSFLREVHGWNAARGVFLALLIASEQVGADVPPAVLDELRPSDWNPQLLSLPAFGRESVRHALWPYGNRIPPLGLLLGRVPLLAKRLWALTSRPTRMAQQDDIQAVLKAHRLNAWLKIPPAV